VPRERPDGVGTRLNTTPLVAWSASRCRQAPTRRRTGTWDAYQHHNGTPTDTTMSPDLQEDRNARLVRNLLALRMVLSIDQMQTGKWGDRIEEIDEELAALGHDMKSTAACATESLRRTFLLPRLVNRRSRAAHRPPARAVPRE
jgi:hypothetical protein